MSLVHRVSAKFTLPLCHSQTHTAVPPLPATGAFAMSSAPADPSAATPAATPAEEQRGAAVDGQATTSAAGDAGTMTVVDVESGGSAGEEAKGGAQAAPAAATASAQPVVAASKAAQAISDRLASLSSRQGAELSWHNVKLSIGGNHILHGVSGCIRPGTLTAIMGTCWTSPHTRGQGAVVVGGCWPVAHGTVPCVVCALRRPEWSWQDVPPEHPCGADGQRR